jgi:hypothetical protein
MPKLERPATTRTSVNTNINNTNNNTINNNSNDDNNQTKQTQLKRKSTGENKAVTKKRKSI